MIKVQSGKTATGAELNNAGYFNTWNRNKLGITLNMIFPEAKELVLKLVEISDVVVENFTPRVMANWGLNYETLKEVRPDIIMVSLSGMGQTGPWRDSVALGPTVQALSGLTCLTSFNKENPVGMGYSYADSISGLFAAMVILAALEHRAKTGEGKYIDISEYEAMCSLLGPAILDYSVNQNLVLPQGNASEYVQASPHGCYRCLGTDRWCVIAVFNDDEWNALCYIMGKPQWTKLERFSTLSQRLEHTLELNDLIEQWTVNYAPEDVMKMLQGVGVPAAVVNNAADMINDPQLKSRGFFTQLHHPVLGDTYCDSNPIRLSKTPAQLWRAAPVLGEDNRYVYQDLIGLDEQQYSQYIEKGIIS